jgi:Xaa-Pro aminopeptidase
MKNYIVFKNENALYFECGYSCDNAVFLKLGKDGFFITDGRYELEAKEAIKKYQVIISKDLIGAVVELLNKNKIKKITIDPNEWSLFAYNKLKENISTKIELNAFFSHKKRIIKSKKEIKYLQKAVNLGKSAFDDIARSLQDKKGFREFELNFLCEQILRDFGSRNLSFEPIFAINENAAKPHALPSKKRLKKGDLILLDAGVKYKRYCSDRTRTAYFNKDFSFNLEQKFKSKKIQKIYDIVLKAHDKAIAKAKVGMKANEIDKIARDVIQKAGFGKYFVHSTGHGVGLDIHEMPYISPKDETIIKEGMVFTIEPGIYIPKFIGIRIEDMVVMQKDGAKIL